MTDLLSSTSRPPSCDLTTGWDEYYDSISQRAFYAHRESGITSWTDPTSSPPDQPHSPQPPPIPPKHPPPIPSPQAPPIPHTQPPPIPLAQPPPIPRTQLPPIPSPPPPAIPPTLPPAGAGAADIEGGVLRLMAALEAQKKALPSRAAIWEPNDASAACRVCGGCFTLLKRRHHCRACGLLVCQDCAPSKALML